MTKHPCVATCGDHALTTKRVDSGPSKAVILVAIGSTYRSWSAAYLDRKSALALARELQEAAR